MKKESDDNVVLISSAPKGYGKKIIENQISQMNKQNAILKRKLAEIKRNTY